ncbi:hypothetical protein KIPB_016412, partial [Kipferlia bialata]
VFLYMGWEYEGYLVDMLEDGQDAQGMVTGKNVEQRTPRIEEEWDLDTTTENTMPEIDDDAFDMDGHDMDNERDMDDDEEWLGYRCVVTVSFGAEEYNVCDSQNCR